VDFDSLMSWVNLSLAGAIFVVTATLKQILGKFFTSPVGQRLLPLIPLVLGVGLSLAGFHDGRMSRWQDLVIVGVLSGAFSGQIFKIGRTSLLGRGLDPTAPESSASVTPPPPEPPKGA